MVVNEQTTMPLAAYSPSEGQRRHHPFSFTRLSRLLGFSAPRTPRRPLLNHPIDELTVFNGVLCRVHPDQISTEYMDLPEIEVVRKVSLRELEDGRCEYRFELNSATDGFWRFYYKRLVPDVAVQFEGPGLVMVCFPAELEASYQKVRDGIAWANGWYGEELGRLVPLVMARDEERQAAREMEMNRKIGLRRQFDYLEL